MSRGESSTGLVRHAPRLRGEMFHVKHCAIPLFGMATASRAVLRIADGIDIVEAHCLDDGSPSGSRMFHVEHPTATIQSG